MLSCEADVFNDSTVLLFNLEQSPCANLEVFWDLGIWSKDGGCSVLS